MLQYIIDAYGQKNKEEGFFKELKDMKKVNKIALIVILIEVIVAIVFVFLTKLECFIYSIIVIVVTSLIYIFISTRTRRKNWHENIEQYNKTLDDLKTILCGETIQYYSKSKIKILIHQCEQSINEIITQKEKFKTENNNFIEKFIIPIVAFAVGIMSTELKSEDMLTICLIALIFIILLNFSIKGFSYVLEDIEGNLVEERLYMRDKLQDLLVRDFDVEEEIN